MQVVHMFCFKHRWIFCTAILLAATIWTLRTTILPSGGVTQPPIDVMESIGGWGLLLAGLGLRFWSTLYIGGRKSKAVVDLGPYSVCRNPLYIANLLIFASVALFLRSWVFMASIASVAGFYHFFVIPYEEANLRRRLGSAYDEYRLRVPCWIPNFSLYRDSKFISVKTKNLVGEARRTAVWILVPFVLEFIRHEIW
ncbi:isoprenylcysteine carboxylmethyltransferase family protein [bacterium]|nr:isoprenylcysteine carboxylmethyltransferase family protein [bacterium]